MNASSISRLVTDKVGYAVVQDLADSGMLLDAINAACRSFALWSGATRRRISATFTNGRWAAPANVMVIEHMEAPVHLFETTFKDILERTPGWATNTRPALHWFRISPKEIGIDGTHPGHATVVVLEEPLKLASVNADLDDRIRNVDENAIVLLAAAHLLQNAADGQSLQQAAILRREGRNLAGMRRQ